MCALGAQVCWLAQGKNHYSPFSCNCKIIFSYSVFLLANFLLINFVSGIASYLFDYFFSNYFLTVIRSRNGNTSGNDLYEKESSPQP